MKVQQADLWNKYLNNEKKAVRTAVFDIGRYSETTPEKNKNGVIFYKLTAVD